MRAQPVSSTRKFLRKPVQMTVAFNGAAVTAGRGLVGAVSGNGANTVTLNLSGVTNAQRIAVTLFNAHDGLNTGDVDVPMGILIGDTSGNGFVNTSDVGQTKSVAGQGAVASNFREDVNANGAISATDVSFVKSLVGTTLPAQP